MNVNGLKTSPFVEGIEGSCQGVYCITRSIEKGMVKFQEIGRNCHTRGGWSGWKKPIPCKDFEKGRTSARNDLDVPEI